MKLILRLFGITLVMLFGHVPIHAQPALIGRGDTPIAFPRCRRPLSGRPYPYPGAPANVYDLTNLVQSLASSTISSNLADASPGGSADPTDAGVGPPGRGYVCTRPTGDRFTLLM